MKVLICIPCLLTGGTEIQTLNTIHALIAAGHQVTTVCYFEYSDNMVNCYKAAGSSVICIEPSGKRIHGWRILPFLYKGLRRVTKQVQPDVVHVQYMAPGAIPIFMLYLLGIDQIIATAHTAADIYPNLRLIHLVQKHFVRAFTCITLKAEESFFGSAQLYGPHFKFKRRNHFTIYNALPSYIEISQTRKPRKGPYTLGVVSRLESIKGMDLVIPAFAAVAQHNPNVRLLIVGDGSLCHSMQQQATELGVAPLVEWKGRQAQQELSALYDRIDILLMPSRSEGFGLTAIEGMARGCVVVASRVGGLPEVIKEGETGLLHESENTEDMVIRLNTLLSNNQLLMELSKKAQENVSQFAFEHYAQAFQHLYLQITAK